jgi:hypothetical protein
MNSKVVYSVNIGGYDNLIEPIKEKGIKYIYITDRIYKSDVWQFMNPIVTFDDPAVTNRFHKILYFNMFDCDTLYIDSNVELLCKPSVIFEYLKGNDMACFDHSKASDSRDNILDEIKACIRIGKDSKEKLESLYEFMQKNHTKKGLICGNIIARSDSYVMRELMKDWWDMCRNWTFRDQCTFNYLADYYKIKINYIQKNLRNNDLVKVWKHKT